MANTFVKIASVSVGSGGASSMAFSSIPATYTDLKVVLSVRSSAAGTFQNMLMKFNGLTTNQSRRMIYGDGSAVSSASDSPFYVQSLTYNTATANTFSNMEYYFPNYTSSNYKSASFDGVGETNATAAPIDLVAGLWSSTAAITSLEFYPAGANSFAQYSTATLYGIKNS